MNRTVRMYREQKRLEKVAEERGYDSIESMLYDMYAVQRIPLKRLRELLYTPMWSLRRRLGEICKMRSRGGRNNVKVEMTEELYNEVIADGVPTVADRIGVDQVSLQLRMMQYALSRE